jgi:hypothetical protein
VLLVPVNGSFSFRVASSDVARLSVAGALVAHAEGGAHAPLHATPTLWLEAGAVVDVQLDWAGAAPQRNAVRVEWSWRGEAGVASEWQPLALAALRSGAVPIRGSPFWVEVQSG